MNKKCFHFTGVLFLVFGLMSGASVYADDYYCTGTVEAGSYENVIVPHSNEECFLKGTEVKGNIEVKKGGRLSTEGATIEGNILAYKAKYIKINSGTYVGGNIKIEKASENKKRGNHTGETSIICGSEINGDVQLLKNHVPFVIGCPEDDGNLIGGNLQVEENHLNPKKFDEIYYAISIQYNLIKGDLQIFKNKSKDKFIWISANQIDGNLQCKRNIPEPWGGIMNIVGGNAEGQCDDLAYMCP